MFWEWHEKRKSDNTEPRHTIADICADAVLQILGYHSGANENNRFVAFENLPFDRFLLTFQRNLMTEVADTS